MEDLIFINQDLYKFDISNFEYVGIKKISDIDKNIDNILMLKSINEYINEYKTAEIIFNFYDKSENKNYYFLINDFGFMGYSNHFSEKYDLFQIIDEYHESSILINEYKNSFKIDVNNDEIQFHSQNGVTISSLNKVLELFQKYYPVTHSLFQDELDDFSYKMIIKKDKLESIDYTMMSKLIKQFKVVELKNGDKEFYKLKFSYEK